MEYKVTMYYSSIPKVTRPRSVKLGFKLPVFPCPSLTAYVMLGIVSFLEIPPRAKFFVDFL